MAAGGLSELKGRSNLAYVKQYLQYGTFPKDCQKVDRRAVRKRAKTFAFIKGQLYYTGGRPKRNGNEDGDEDTPENPENDESNSQSLRKCCITEEEKHEAVRQSHVGEDGTHYGVDKTTERLSTQYYWVGITNSVRKVLRSCSECLARGVRGPNANSSLSTSMLPVVISSSESLIKEEQEIGTEPDVFFVSQEISSYFWQKVELQVFGPYMASGSRKQVYVAVAMDTFSQFPEATVLETISSAKLTSFIVNLICRYGVMEKVCLLQNQATRNVYMYLNMQDLELADISPTFLSQHANPADLRWQRIEKSLERFVKLYPKWWDKCLEAFMVPLRISLPPENDYTPVFLAHGREPVLPPKLSHKSQDTSSSELSLTEDYEKQTVELLMAAYGLFSKKAVRTDVPDIGLDLLPVVKVETLTLQDEDVAALTNAVAADAEPQPVESSPLETRSRREGARKKGVTVLTPADNDAFGIDSDDDDFGRASDYDDDADETYTPSTTPAPTRRHSSRIIVTRASKRKRKPTYKAQTGPLLKKAKIPAEQPPPERAEQKEEETPVKRLRGRPRKVKPDEGDGGCPDLKRSNQALTSDGLINSVEQLDLDAYYLMIRRYKEQGTYPPRVSVDFKRAIRRLAETVELKDGKLYGHVGKASGRLIITNERERFSLLRKAHVKGEEHVGRVRVLKTLLDMNVFWKGMSLDLDAFIHACPECVSQNPLRNKTVVRIPTKSKALPADRDDSDPHMSEDEEEESSYEDLIQFLTDGTFPNTVTEEQQNRIKQRSKFFCIINGSLYYKPPSHPNATPRQVVFAEKLRQEALQEAHIEEERHLSQQDTQAKLREKYFWSGMTYDVMRYIVNCCMAESLSSRPIPHRNSAVQERVEKFHNYYLEGIPYLLGSSALFGGQSKGTQGPAQVGSTSAEGDKENQQAAGEEIPASEASKETEESVDESKECEIEIVPDAAPDSALDLRSKREEDAMRRAVDAAIEKLSKSDGRGTQTVDPVPKAKPPAMKVPSHVLGPTPQQIRSQKAKTKHKCDHCGRIIKGDVAFKVHLYKHTGIKPFSCSVCGKMFSNKKSQRIHMRKHTGIRPYLCNQCGRDFFRSASLRYHLKAHATGRGTPVSCDICKREFTTQHRLNRHKEFKHPATAKVFMCNQCGKMFTAARSLKRHEQTHTGIRKYHCQYCSKSFFRKEYLNSHLTNHAEWDPEVEKLKPRKRPGKKSQKDESGAAVVAPGPTGDHPPTNVIHWTETEQAASRITQSSATDLDSYSSPGRAGSSGQGHSTTHTLTLARPHIVATSASAGTHTVHHTMHHPLPQGTTRLMSVAGPHGPLAVTVSASGQPIEVVHAGHEAGILLQHEAVPVQYEVECLTGDPSSLTEADLNAIHMLAQASLTGQNIMHQ
ncbi:hypothetical protein BaRGS_00031991 [Batillaria attramentaria]|uniref:C2H2-type domain-containing protein n=1 Tax=Batillaria attramentaria TaxID=370345 RepID=A0ABD0JNW8_9CAEN